MVNRIAETTLPDGKWVSTVELDYGNPLEAFRSLAGAVLQKPIGKPFETMVFACRARFSEEVDVQQYDTVEEARAGHEAMVRKWSVIQ